jgi:ligand-binding sensor domain-containing protein
MKTAKFLILILFLSSQILSQQIGDWKNYTSLRNVVTIDVDAENNSWGATSGGIFQFNPQDSTFKVYTKSEGLNSNSITSLAIDNDGKIWTGNVSGVINVIDPINNRVRSIFDIQKSNFSLKGINHLSVSGDTVFAATDFGIAVLNAKTLSIIEDYSKFGSFLSGVRVFYAVKLGVIYACTESGLAIQKSNAVNLSAPESWNVFETGTDIPADRILKVVKHNNGLIASTDGDGILFYDNVSWTQNSFAGNVVKDIAANGDSIIAVFTNSIYSIKGNVRTLLQSFQGLTLNSIKFKDSSTFLVGSSKGILDFGATPQKYHLPNGPMSNSFPSIDLDSKGNLWSASGRDIGGVGAYSLNGNEWTNYNSQNGLEVGGNAIHKIYIDNSDNIYFSSWGNGFTRLSNGVFETFNENNTSLVGTAADPNFMVIQNIVKDSDQNIWLLNSQTFNPISVITPDSIFHYKPPFFNGTIVAENLIIDRNRTKWFTLSGEGLFYFNENGTFGDESDDIWGRFTEADGLNDNAITALAIDNRDDIWIGTPLGVNFIFDPNNGDSRIQNLFSSIQQQSITCIAVDAINQKWFGTNQGVFLMSSDAVSLIDNFTISNSPIPSNEITSIAADGITGKIYIGTDAGLSSVISTSLQPENSFSELFIYPNPFVVGNANDNLVIKGLVRNSQIKILTVSGKLVNELSTPGGGITQWDGKDSKGKTVPSGVYLVVAYDEEANNVTTAKVAIIKK